MLDDLRYGLRGILRNPSFAITAILTMALTIGAGTAVFSVVNAILLRPLPAVADPAGLVSVFRTQSNGVFDNLSYPDFTDYRDRNVSFSGLAAHSPTAVNLSGERLRGDLVTGNYFDVLGVKAAAGRLVADGDAAVLSYGLWRREFGGKAEAVGSRVVLNGVPFTIGGVAAEGFRGTAIDDAVDIWVPIDAIPRLNLRLSAGILEDRAAGWVWMFGRLKPGVKFETARAEMRTIAGRLAAAYPLTNAGRWPDLGRGLGMYPDDRAEQSGLLSVLSASVALLLFLACANVAGLFLVRGSRRGRELAIRFAVGGARGRIVRQLVTEGVLLAAIAGMVALLLSQWAAQAIAATSGQTSLLRRLDLSADGRVFGFTLLACLVTGLLFSIGPALQSSKLDLVNALKSGGGGGAGRPTPLRSVLVAGQVALSLILLGASGMLARSVYRIVMADPGFETNKVAMFSIDMSGLGYSREHRTEVQRQIVERLRQLPGVVSASLAATVPPQDFSGRVSIFHPGEEPSPELFHGREFELGLRVDINTVSPGYFQTMGIALIQGRDFADRDRAVIVSRRLAEKMWPGESAVGQRIAWPEWGGPPRAPFEVIGVAADAKYRTLTGEAPLLLYIPTTVGDSTWTHAVIRTASDPATAVGEAARVIQTVDKEIAAYRLETMRDHMAESLWQQRMAASWIGAFSLMALILAGVGLYGVVAQTVARRTREVGIRMALGAEPKSVARLMMLDGMRVALAGVAVGVPAALGFDRSIGRFVTGVGGNELPGLLAMAAVLIAAMLVAVWIPARRAARVDPNDALRSE